MEVKLTEHQKLIVKNMVRMSEAWANSIYTIMHNHALDLIEGCRLCIEIDPKYPVTLRLVELGQKDTDFGFAMVVRGTHHDEYILWPDNSKEYEDIFEDEAIRSGIKNAPKAEKPLPPDGLWIGGGRYDYPLDRGEWDLNDSLS